MKSIHLVFHFPNDTVPGVFFNDNTIDYWISFCICVDALSLFMMEDLLSCGRRYWGNKTRV